MKALSDLQIGYIAAAFDGEGNIGLGRTFQDQMWKYRLHCNVSNSNVAMLEYLKVTTGLGKISPGSKRQNPRHKPVLCWELAAEEIPMLLRAIVDALVIKKQQALLMLEYLDKCYRVSRHAPLTEEGVVLREVIYQELSELNHRGTS